MSSHFGNPLNEQRLLLEGKAYVERQDEVVLELTGPTTLAWLHSITSQNLINLKPGDSAESLVLSPTGHIEHQLKVIATDVGALVITAAAHSEALVSWLSSMRFRHKIEIKVLDKRVFGCFKELDGPCWIDRFGFDPVGSVRYAAEAKLFGYREYVLDAAPTDLQPAGMLAYEALRIAVGRPEISDVDERTLPHELDWLATGVHLSKGCYRGQETVSKVHNLGHPPRRLIQLNLEVGDTLAAKGESVYHRDREVGKILAGGLHFEDGSIALALVSRVTPFGDLTVANLSASQTVVVPPDAGKAANLPRPSAFKLSGKK